jgi:O-antigen/teichoic acid export membrane protein
MAGARPTADPVVTQKGGLRRATTRAAGGTAVAVVLTQVLSLAVYAGLARLATPAVFGVLAAASLLVAIGEMVADSGMTAAVVQRRDRVDAAAATALVSRVVMSVILALVALAASPLVGLYFGSREVALVAAALPGLLVINAVTGVPGALLQRRLALHRWLIVEPAGVISYGIVAAIGLTSDLGVWALVLAWYVSAVTRAAGIWVALRWRPRLRLVSFAMWRELARYARHIFVSEMLRNATSIATTAIVGRYLGPGSLGQFRFAWRLVTQAIEPVLKGGGHVLQPALVRVADDSARTTAGVLSALRLLSIVAAPVSAMFIPLGEPIAVVLFGDQWRGTGVIAAALCGMAFALVLESLSSEVFKARGRPDILPRMHGLLAILSISLMVVLIPFGAPGVALGLSLSTLCVAFYALRRLTILVGISPGEVVQAIMPPVVSASLMAGTLYFFDREVISLDDQPLGEALARISIDVVVGLVIYLLSMAVVGREALKELRATLVSLSRMRGAEAK